MQDCLSRAGWDLIINCADKDLDFSGDSGVRLWLNINYGGCITEGSAKDRLSWEMRMTQAVDRAIEVLSAGGLVLSHCVAGRHRSVTETIVILACWMRTSLKEAIFVYTSGQRMSEYDMTVVSNILARRGIEDWIIKYNEVHPKKQSSGSSGVATCSGGSGRAQSSGSSGVLELNPKPSTRDRRRSRSPSPRRRPLRPTPPRSPPPRRLSLRPTQPPYPPPAPWRKATLESPVRAASSKSHSRPLLRSPERPPARASSAPPPDSPERPPLPRFQRLKLVASAPLETPPARASPAPPPAPRVPGLLVARKSGAQLVAARSELSGSSGVLVARSGVRLVAAKESEPSGSSGVLVAKEHVDAKRARREVPPPTTAGMFPVSLSPEPSSSDDEDRPPPGPNHPEVRDAPVGTAWQCIRCQNMNAVDRATCSNVRCAAAKPRETDRNCWQQRIASDIIVEPSV